MKSITGTLTDDLSKICDGNIECVPTAILLVSLVHALYGHLGPEPEYFKNKLHKNVHGLNAEYLPRNNFDFHKNAEDLTDFKPRTSNKQEYIALTAERTHFMKKASPAYDFIVVGGGTAGCVVASRLSENRRWRIFEEDIFRCFASSSRDSSSGRGTSANISLQSRPIEHLPSDPQILLVEAGPEEPKVALIPGLTTEFIGSTIDWQYAMRPNSRFCQNRRELGCEVVQGRVLGGTSTINDLAYLRGSPADYDEWAVLGNDGWSFSQVLPYFKHSEGNYDTDISVNKYFHSTQGPLDVGRYPYADQNVDILFAALNEMGFNRTDVNARYQLGTMRVQSTSYFGERVSSYTAFLDPIRNMRTNIDIVTGALVTKILVEVEGDLVRATGVEFIRNGTVTKIKCINEVILCAGAINTPKILMQSGIGPKDYLEYLDIPVFTNLPVGRNFQDHVSICLPVIKLGKTNTMAKFSDKMHDITTYYERGIGPLSANFQVIAFLETHYSEILGTPDIEIRFKGHDSNMYYDRMDLCISLLTPQSRGEVILNSSDPMFGKPLIYPNFLKHHTDEKKLLEGMQEMMKIFDTDVFKQAEIEFDPFPLLNNECKQEEHVSEKFWLCVLRHFSAPLHNYAGTCKMGPLKDPDSVVDSQLRVYGVSHLRVVDASIMPKITRGGIAATVVMIAEKASDLIKGQWY